MRAVLCWLALGAVPALGQPGGGPIAPFAIYTHFEHEPSGPVLDSLKQESTSILSAVGLSYEWRNWDAREGQVSRGLAVVNFRGACDVSGPVRERVELGPLGWTYVTDGDVLPFSDVDCNRVRAFLSKSLLRLRAADRERAFGRAIARVLAHELYHVITETGHHGSSGVAEAAYTVSDLLSGKFSFSEADQRLLGGRVAASQFRRSKADPEGRSLFARSGCAQCHGPLGKGAEGAPSLRAGRILNMKQLAARLADKASRMYTQAHDRGNPWPALAEPDIEGLVTYLNASLE